MLDFTLLFIFFLEIIDHFYHRYLQLFASERICVLLYGNLCILTFYSLFVKK